MKYWKLQVLIVVLMSTHPVSLSLSRTFASAYPNNDDWVVFFYNTSSLFFVTWLLLFYLAFSVLFLFPILFFFLSRINRWIEEIQTKLSTREKRNKCHLVSQSILLWIRLPIFNVYIYMDMLDILVDDRLDKLLSPSEKSHEE
jgi:hypothetical protein